MQRAAVQHGAKARDGICEPRHRPGLGHPRVERLHVSEHALEGERGGLVEALEKRPDARHGERCGAQRERV